ncbi:carbohydrate ABC transporter permease [Arthrobacter citreus]|uniref:carbohydrate ABC transporter permease n=1 Tax=Arthrobacter TaxID=1663 RepID=UPI001264D9AF|nr:sugar ABC transporter permease [Arthrobacter gandavensis]
MTTKVQSPADAGRPRSSSAGGPSRRRSGAAAIASARPWLLLTPALAVLALLLLWPLIRVVLFSFQDYGLRQIVSGETNFIGAGNYVEALTDSQLWSVVLPNTILFAVTAVLCTVVLGTLVAILMTNLGVFWRTVVGSAIMVAWAMPAVTGTYVWVWIFDADNGIVNQLLMGAGLMDEPFNWFTNRWTFYLIVLINVVHHGFPFVAITVMAGLLGVSKEMLEAAEMDGAGAFRRFFQIVFPSLRQVFAVVIILSTIWDFKVFGQVYLMPGGSGTNRSVLNLGVWSYVESFGQNRYGFGSAIAVLLTLVLLAITVIYIRVLMKEDEL